jgi:hypothetical protein
MVATLPPRRLAAMKNIAVTLEVVNEAQAIDRAATPNLKERR